MHQRVKNSLRWGESRHHTTDHLDFVMEVGGWWLEGVHLAEFVEFAQFLVAVGGCGESAIEAVVECVGQFWEGWQEF